MPFVNDSEFKATAAGPHVLELQVFSPDGRSDVRQLTVEARTRFSETDPALEPKFGTVLGLFKPTIEGGLCATGCHLVNAVLSPALSVDNLLDQPLYDELRSRINFETPALSPLLTKPAGQHHAGLSPLVGSPSPTPAGSALNWQEFLQHWVLMGAPR